MPDGPCAAAGMVSGDAITSVASIPVKTEKDVAAAMKGRRPGDSVTLTWTDADGHARDASLVLVPGPPE